MQTVKKLLSALNAGLDSRRGYRMKSLYCAACAAMLPRPVLWKRDKDTMLVRDWNDALIAYERGFRFIDDTFMKWGIYAVTQVAGTLYCYGHGYFAMKRVFKEMQNAASQDSQVGMDRKEDMARGRSYLRWKFRRRVE